MKLDLQESTYYPCAGRLSIKYFASLKLIFYVKPSYEIILRLSWQHDLSCGPGKILELDNISFGKDSDDYTLS